MVNFSEKMLQDTMEEFLWENFDGLLDIINGKSFKNNIIISGSTALYFYMKSIGMEPKFSPGDIDIYCNMDDYLKLDTWIKTNIREINENV